ncbi:efflux RND transporter periplasmic adaptor subunit [Salinisphaera sp. Q1T1-3]|uniref:efflux RND transporter periplasmic adaptor subunit n=1 Tax=Salinisphaera sp. Q1T1-3 TaxID=2321229 RepID=UPI000E765221|nr:efflux RND transporter periplasmic adaptor subunit [Salinisphaera sp. Q1T1-3]RJS94292.1 efflux RND transporter periplasmic adaptor subunit [Salinisphaera sp. Q1T1-3]
MTIKRLLIVLVMLAVLAGLIWYGFFMQAGGPPTTRGAGAADRGVPILTARATTKNVPIILNGVGTIQAFQTVTVQPQVGGKLLSVNFTEGQRVEKGDVLAKIDPVTYKADLDEAKAQLALDQSALANARLDLKRYAKLAKTNYVSQQQADQARATVRQDEAQVASDKAAIDSARATLSYTSVKAPITGRTGLRQVDEGNIVQADSTDLVVITQVKPITAVFTLPSDDIGAITAARRDDAKLTVTVTGAQSNDVLDTGELSVVNNQVDTDTGTIRLKAVFPNEQEQLWPGQFVNAHLRVGTRTDATVVPIAAVQEGPNGAFVYTIDADDKAAMQSVDVLQQNETEAVIGSGLAPGDEVITAGFGQLSDGTKIKRPKTDDASGSGTDTSPGIAGAADDASSRNRTSSPATGQDKAGDRN